MIPQVEGLIVRLDDVRTFSPRLARIWDTLEQHGVPVHLQVIPTDLDRASARLLTDRAARCRVPVAVHQHGYSHVNHGEDARPFEFDDSRNPGEQRAEILRGRDLLEEHCGELFEPIFTPPWDRLGSSTLHILAAAGFVAVSTIERSSRPTHPDLCNIAMTTDPVTWRRTPVHKPWRKTLRSIQDTLERTGRAGLELHHEIMGQKEANGLDQVLGSLAAAGTRWPSMLDVAKEQRA